MKGRTIERYGTSKRRNYGYGVERRKGTVYRIVPGRDTELVICVNGKTEEVKLQNGVVYCEK